LASDQVIQSLKKAPAQLSYSGIKSTTM